MCEKAPAVAVTTSITGVVSRRGGDGGDPRERSCEESFRHMRGWSVH